MKAIRIGCLALAFVAIGGFWSQLALADEAASIYDPSKVVFIDLTLSPTEEAKLEAEPGEYVKGTFSLTRSSDGTPAGEEASPVIAPRPVEVRLKGNVGGSFRPLTGKAGFKLKFKKTETVFGLRKMTLNNMVQDPSMVHETLAYAAFRAAGVPASRTGFAYVRLNGNDVGVYLDLENLDEIGLARIFGSFDKETQHLYEGEDGHDVKPGEAKGPGAAKLLAEGVIYPAGLKAGFVVLGSFVPAGPLEGCVKAVATVIHRPDRHSVRHRPGLGGEVGHDYEVGSQPPWLE
jgi:hypothetical protein